MNGVDLSTYVVLDAPACAAIGMEAMARAAGRGGAGVLQVRDKQATARQLFEAVCRVADAVTGRSLAVVVNDRVDVAVAARRAGHAIAGAHIGADDLPATWARDLLGPDALLGLSVSDDQEVAEALRLPAGTVDYLGIGPVYATATKPDADPPVGPVGAVRLAGQAAAARLPCVGIGGLTPADSGWARGGGLAGLAVVSAVCRAPDPQAATRTLVTAWAGAGMSQVVRA